MNVLLRDTEEFIDGKNTGTLGLVLIRCVALVFLITECFGLARLCVGVLRKAIAACLGHFGKVGITNFYLLQMQ